MDIRWGLNQKVQWAARGDELDAYAQPKMIPMGTISARIKRKVQVVKNQDGVDEVSSTQVHVTDNVKPGDQITVGERAFRVISVADGLGLYAGGPSFFILYL